jgi:hypothetical protein
MMSEHSLDDPVEPDVAAGEHHADETLESESTGAHYRSDGSVEATPEDERRLEEIDEAEAEG